MSLEKSLISPAIIADIKRLFGGEKFEKATGAADWVAGTRIVQFRVPLHSTANKCTHVNITPNENGTYDMSFVRFNRRTVAFEILTEWPGVRPATLPVIFEQQTKLKVI